MMQQVSPGEVHCLRQERVPGGEPLGRRRYWKLYEAAVHHDLPLGIHYGGWGGMPITGAGYPSFYIEDSGGMATAFQDQVTSMVLDGVFVRFPTLKMQRWSFTAVSLDARPRCTEQTAHRAPFKATDIRSSRPRTCAPCVCASL